VVWCGVVMWHAARPCMTRQHPKAAATLKNKHTRLNLYTSSVFDLDQTGPHLLADGKTNKVVLFVLLPLLGRLAFIR